MQAFDTLKHGFVGMCFGIVSSIYLNKYFRGNIVIKQIKYVSLTIIIGLIYGIMKIWFNNDKLL